MMIKIFFTIATFMVLLNYRVVADENTTVESEDINISRPKDNIKIQMSLQNMGYYSDTIDGDINTFASCKAITMMNEKFQNKKSPSLTPKSKAILIELAPLYALESELSSDRNTTKEINIKIQTSLRILGFSTSASDGIMGSRSLARIASYKRENGLNEKLKLTILERQELISKAKAKNSEAIEKLKEQLKAK